MEETKIPGFICSIYPFTQPMESGKKRVLVFSKLFSLIRAAAKTPQYLPKCPIFGVFAALQNFDVKGASKMVQNLSMSQTFEKNTKSVFSVVWYNTIRIPYCNPVVIINALSIKEDF